jgi:Peptidase A4 family
MTASKSRVRSTLMIGRLKIRLFEIPPANFNPLTAPNKLLSRYGYPPFEDIKASPNLRRNLGQMFTRKSKFILPSFLQITHKRHGPMKRDERFGPNTSKNWSGVVVLAPAGDTIQWVSGNWTVPNPHAQTNDGISYTSSAWIGIDGGKKNVSYDVVQAGTDQDTQNFNGTATTNIHAWFEWYPELPMLITNFPVSAGDTIHCAIWVTALNMATIFMSNLTNSTAVTPFAVTAPQNISLAGDTAEWIMERPEFGTILGNLPEYGIMFFDSPFALTRNSPGGLYPSDGTSLNMTDDNGNIISESTIESDNAIRLEYVG